MPMYVSHVLPNTDAHRFGAEQLEENLEQATSSDYEEISLHMQLKQS
jgi:hypothetical protein